MKFSFLIISLIAYTTLNDAYGQTVFSGLPFINNYGPETYNGGIQNWQITQDKRGIIYVANNFGVLEFDGAQWRQFPLERGTKVRSVCLNNQGTIFVGSQGDFGALRPNQNGAYEFHSFLRKVPPQYQNFDEVWRVFVDDNQVYFCTFSNIYIYNGSEIKVVQTNRALEPSYFVGSRLFVQSPGYPLMTLDKNQELQPIDGGHLFSDKIISGILPYSKDEILITTQNSGIFLYNGFRLTKWHFPLIGSSINCALRLKDGRIVIGTQSDGIYILDLKAQVQLHLTKSHGLVSNTVLSLFQDKEDNLWTGLNNGISHIELASPLTQMGDNLGIEGTGYAAYAMNGILYLGTNTGLYQSRSLGAQPKHEGTFKYSMVENSDGQVYNIQKIANDLFIGHHNGPYLLKNSKAIKISNTGAWIFLRNPENASKVIFGNYSGINTLYQDKNSWKDTGRMQGFYESSRVMELDEDNHLWMTHGYKGVFRLKIDYERDTILDLKFYNSQHGFPSDILINVFKINNELLFTAKQGVYKYDKQNDRFESHPEFTELLGPDIHIRDMDEDPLGNIYFITNGRCGVIRKTASGEMEVDYNSFNKIPKLLNDDLVNVNAIDVNNVIFSAKEGFVHFQPNKVVKRIADYPIFIRKVECTSDNDSVLFDGNFQKGDQIIFHQPENFSINLPYSNNDIRIAFASPYFEGIDDLKYRYQLKKYDKGWSAWNSKTDKEYTNLPSGDYEFLVMSKNIFGETSDIGSFKFSIQAPWYRSFAAYTLYTFTGLLTVVLGMFFVDRKHKNDKIKIHAKQKQELNSKEKQFESAQQQKKAEITKLRNEKLNAELNHKNCELASATMHLLNKNALIADIRSKLTNIKNEADKSQTKKGIGNILKEIEAGTNLDKDWEQFEFHFDRVHRDFNKRLKEEFPQLTPQEMKLCAYLRLNFTTKEIAQLLHISVRGVEISRYRLRKKLGLLRQENLTEFILHY